MRYSQMRTVWAIPYTPAMAKAESLFRLQLIDNDLDAARKRVKEIDTALAGSPAVNHARSEQVATHKARLEAVSALKMAELDDQTLEEKLKTEEQRLYAGLIKTPKEMVDVQHEIESLKRRRADADEVMLKAIEALDVAKADEIRCDAALKEALVHFEGDSVSLRLERAKLVVHFNAQAEMRKAAVSGIPKPDLDAGMLKEGGLAVSLDYDSAWTSAAMKECDKFCSDDVGQLLSTKGHGVYFGGIPETITADLGELAAGLKPGRANDGERIFSMNMGIAVDDMVTAKVLYERALERGAGVRLPL